MKFVSIILIFTLLAAIGSAADTTYAIKNADGDTVYLKEYAASASSPGAIGNPLVPYHMMDATQFAIMATAANQVTGNADLAAIRAYMDGSGVPISGEINATITEVGLNATTLEAIETISIGSALPAGTNLLGKMGIDQVTANANEVVVKSITAGDTNVGNFDLASAIPAGTNLMGKVGIDQTTPGTTNGVVVNSGTVSLSQTTNANDVDIASALPAGTNAIGKLAANTGVDIGDVDVTSVIPGTGATSLGKAEDAIPASGDTGVMPLAIRHAANSALSGTDGDYEPLQTNASGFLKVTTDTGTASSGAVTNTVLTDAHDNTNNSIRVIDIGASQSTIDSVMIAGSKSSVPTNLTMDSSSNLNTHVASITAGDTNIGNVDLASAIPTGTNTIGAVYPTAGNMPYTGTPYKASGAGSANTAYTLTIPVPTGKFGYLFGYEVTNSGAAVGSTGLSVSVFNGTYKAIRSNMAAGAVANSSIIRDSFIPLVQSYTSGEDLSIVVEAGPTGLVAEVSANCYFV